MPRTQNVHTKRIDNVRMRSGHRRIGRGDVSNKMKKLCAVRYRFDGNREWKIKRANIKSHFHAYFPDTSIPQLWHEYSEIINVFFTFAINTDSWNPRSR
jgi:hypothetical protein